MAGKLEEGTSLPAEKLPILVGGTGLYVQSFLYGVRFTEEKAPAGLREQLAAELAAKGGAAMYEELKQADPEAAAAIHPNNQVRVLRALEHYRATGKKLSEQKAESLPPERPYRSLILGLDFPERAVLYRRIDLRVDKMLEAGLMKEAEHVWQNRESFRTAAQAIGYKEFFPYFEQTAPLEACTEKLKQASRNYAKRQLTWFRHMDGVVWLDAGAPDAVQTAIRKTERIFSERMIDMPDETQKERHAPHVLTTLAGVLIAFLLLAAIYVVYQAAHILFPQNVYETALPAVISDTVEADGVLLFDESYVAGSGNLGYLAADGERVSAGTAVAEVYSNASQAALRQQLTQLNDQIDLLQRSQNTSALQLDIPVKRTLWRRCMICWIRWMTATTRQWMMTPMPICWPRTSSGSSPVRLQTLPIRSRRWSSRPRACRLSWAVPPRSLRRRPAILYGLPAAGGSMPARTTSLH